MVVRDSLSELDKAVVALHLYNGEHIPKSASELAAGLEAAGSPKINSSRLRERLFRDKRIIKDGSGFRVAPKYVVEVSGAAAKYTGPMRPVDPKSVIDSGLFDNAHGYIKNIVHQINLSYSHACFDCAAVMIRRIFETLIIDAFEKQGAISEIKDQNGEILMLSGLITKLGSTSSFSVSRQTKQAAAHLKDVGDWSAHNRRYRARQSDLDVAAKHLRLASSDLLHLAGQDGG